MIHRFTTAAAVSSVLVAVLSGCVSVVSVKKFTGTEPGIRYSLPQPYLLVTPKTDGTAAYEWFYLPDPANEYAVQTYSFMAKYTMDVSIDAGLLKKVVSKADTSAVAAKAFDAAQNVYSARTAAATDAAKKDADKAAAAHKAIADAELALKQATAEEKVLNDNAGLNPNNADKLAAKLKVARAQAALDAARSAAVGSGAMNAPDGGGEALGKAWGPVLFKVVQSEDNVRLVAVNIQEKYDTVLAVKSSEPAPIPMKIQEGASKFKFSNSETLTFTVELGEAVEALDEKSATLVRGIVPDSKSKVSFALSPDKKSVVVQLRPHPDPAKYTLTIPYVKKSGQKATPGPEIQFEVVQ